MHPAPDFTVTDPARLLAHLRLHPFMTFVGAPDGRPLVAHAPVVVRQGSERLILEFHLSRRNALADHLANGFRAVAISLGPDAYVSPDWYESDDQVPTWNYLSVEAEGQVAPMDEAGLVGLLDDLSAQEEARLAPKSAWTRGKMSPGRFDAMCRAIIGARLNVERIAGTFKFGQNRSDADRAGVASALGAHPMAGLMRGE